MHYYSFNIGDYASHTRYLTPMEDLAYRRLLDLYYLQEKPIPADNPAELIGLNECSTTVERVLNMFFVLHENEWFNKRVDAEIKAFKAQSKRNSEAGKKSGIARRANKNKALERPFNENEQPLNEPSTTVEPTNNHKPIINTRAKGRSAPQNIQKPDDVSQDVWDEFLQLRKKKKALVTKLVIDGIRSEAEKAGWSLEDVLRQMVVRNWQGFQAGWVAGQKPDDKTLDMFASGL